MHFPMPRLLGRILHERVICQCITYGAKSSFRGQLDNGSLYMSSGLMFLNVGGWFSTRLFIASPTK
jgi:hypothetical protein